MKPDPIARRTMLIAAGIIFLAAAVWLIILESGSYTRKICSRINEYGYAVTPSQLFAKGYGSSVSISELLDEDLTEAAAYSRECGFSADVEKQGTVELLLWKMDDDRVMVIWLVDKVPELVFIESSSTGEISPIG